MSPPPAAVARRDLATGLAIILPFILLMLVRLSLHEMWRDEVHAWGVAAGSPSPGALLAALRYEAHPPLWYLLLWPAAQLTDSILAVKAVHGVVAVLVYVMIGLFSPFSVLEKVLLCAS